MKTFSSFFKTLTLSLILLATSVSAWADGGIGYKGVKFTKNGTVTGWYNIHNVSWDYYHSSYDCRSGQSGVTDFNNADLGTVTTLKLKAFVVIGWATNDDYVAGQLKYRLYKQSATAGSDSTYNVGNYGNNSWGANNVLSSSNNDQVVGTTSMTTDIVTSSTAPGQYYLQLQGLGRMQWTNNGGSGSFNDNDGSEVKAQLVVPGFTTTSTSQTYDNTTVGNNSSKTILFGTHYGTTLKTSNCSFSGTNASEFSVTSINESGVTVKFTPSSAGSKSATLTITDAHQKKCVISLSGTGVIPTYSYTVTAGEGGKVSLVSGTVAQGSGVTITATPDDGYEFDEWTATNGTLADANSASTTFTPSANDANAKAWFKKAGCTQTPTTPTSLTAKVGGNALAGDVCSGTNVTLTAGGTISVGSLQWGTGTTVGEYIIPDGNGQSSITVSPVATTTYWVRSIITETGDCYGVTSNAKTLQVNVTPALVQPVLSKSTLTLEEGGSNGSITITSGTTGGTWASSDLNVATVDNGIVTPEGPGTATITYTVSNGCEDDKIVTCDVTVTAKPYYIAGRLQQNWNTGSKTQQFTYVSNGQYKYETGKTVAELSAQWQDNSYKAYQYFFIHTGAGLSSSFTSSSNNGHNFHQKLGYANALTLSSNQTNDEKKFIKFADDTDNSSDVVIWWEPSTNKLWYTATANLTTNLYLLGLGSSNWTVNDSRRFVKDENDPTKAKVTITLAKGEYTEDTNDGFKINNNVAGKWYGNNGTMTRSSCTGWSFEDGRHNAGLTADVAGDYVFTLDLTTMKLTVTYPSKLTLTDGPTTSVSSATTSNPLTTVPGQTITATPTITSTGTKAFCWGLYTDAECTDGNKVDNITFTSLGAGKVSFALPEVEKTYYLKLTIHPDADCKQDPEETIIARIDATTENFIFFKKNISASKWNNVYVNFYNRRYWDSEGKGSGNVNSDDIMKSMNNKMTQIKGTNIFYFNYSGITPGNVVSFVNNSGDYDNFYWCQVVYREDMDLDCAPMFVSRDYIQSDNYINDSEYYDGYWTTFAPDVDAKHNICIGNTSYKLESATPTRTYTLTQELSANTTVHFYLQNACYATTDYGYYGTYGEMDVKNCTNWVMYHNDNNIALKTRSAGEYTFIVSFLDNGEIRVSVEYPLMEGDYQLIYKDSDNRPHPSDYVRNRANGEDIVSLYINKEKSPTVTLQQWDGNKWNVKKGLNNQPITVDLSPITDDGTMTSGVYNFKITQPAEEDITSNEAIEVQGRYLGYYYIRTNSAEGKWKTYKMDSHKMTYSAYADENEGFTHYFCEFLGDNKSGSEDFIGTHDDDISFAIACDYAKALTDTLEGDTYTNGLNLYESASVRFMYNTHTNGLRRAYLKGRHESTDYLKLTKGEGNMTLNEGGEPINEITFNDEGNWIYSIDVYVTPVQINDAYTFSGTLTAKYPINTVLSLNTQYFYATPGQDTNSDGIPDSYSHKQIIGGSDGAQLKVAIRYDFKINRLMRAWKPTDEITENLPITADILLIRKGQDAATQINLSSDKAITDVQTIYGAIQFDYNDVVGKVTSWNSHAYEFGRYYVSFPFDVAVSDIFGFGTLNENWQIQRYNGQKRADIGWFAETSTFWEPLQETEVMKANEGYILALDRKTLNGDNNVMWQNKEAGSSVYLYFPSSSATKTIANGTQTIHVPKHQCYIDREFQVENGTKTVNHQNTDSHWNVIGSPLFENKVATQIAEGPETEHPDDVYPAETKLRYFYKWQYEEGKENTYAVSAAFNTEHAFLTMHGYMVQYAGDVTFEGASITPPASVAARRVAENKQNYTVELQLYNEDIEASRTYVELRENAIDSFLLSEDLYMIRSSHFADVFTYAGTYDVAANVLSINSHIVPVGVQVKKAGTYTFSMTTPFDGTVTLIDYHTGSRTNLGWSDYTVTLEKGTINDRFALEINIQNVSTDVEGNTGHFKGKDAVKFLYNGILYIKKGDAIYDARGSRVSMSYEL